jgi:hypothetical protein
MHRIAAHSSGMQMNTVSRANKEEPYSVAVLDSVPLGVNIFWGENPRSLNNSWVLSRERKLPSGSINSVAVVNALSPYSRSLVCASPVRIHCKLHPRRV